MRRRGKLLVAGLVLSLTAVGLAGVLAGPAPASAEAEDPVVLAVPSAGDQGVYTRLSTVEGGQGIEEEGPPEEPVQLFAAWNRTEVLLPNGQVRTLPSLVHWTPPQVEHRGAAAADQDTGPSWMPGAQGHLAGMPWHWGWLLSGQAEERSVSRYHGSTALHFTELPGEPAAVSFQGTFEEVETDDEGTTRLNTQQEVTFLPAARERCYATQAHHLVGLTEQEALAVVERCTQAGPDEEATAEVHASWEEHPDWGHTWVVEAVTDGEVELPDGRIAHVTREVVLRTSPAVSLPLEVTFRSTTEEQGLPTERTTVQRLTGWREGASPLILETEPLGSMPTVDVVAWDRQGPEDGDLEHAPLAEASTAIELTRDGLTYFQAAPEARILEALYVEPTSQLPWRSTASANGIPCQPPADQAVPPRLPEEMGEQAWEVTWTSQSQGMLIGWADRPEQAGDLAELSPAPIYRAGAWHLEDREAWTYLGAPPAQQAPSPQGLRTHQDLVTPYFPEGAPFLRVAASPTGPSSEGAQEVAMVGSVGRATCTWDAPQEKMDYEGLSIRFEEGTATSISRLGYGFDRDAQQAPSLGEVPRAQAPGEASWWEAAADLWGLG